MAQDVAAPVVAVDRAPTVLQLDDRRAADPARTGAKAANLARAAAAGLPVLPGFVVLTSTGTDEALDDPAVRELWRTTSDGGTAALVVRSSSVAEDAASSSLAGQFTSVLDVVGWAAFAAALAEVRASATRVGRRLGEVAPMAVLVQRQLTTSCAGVLFGVEPVSGDRRRLLVEAVQGNPDDLVSGRVNAERYVLDRRGRVLESDGVLLDRRRCRELARLAARTRRAFGSPQDVEWAFDVEGALRLLQSRPVTTVGDRPAHDAPLLGPGPVAETFPAPLRRLEADLWVAPLSAGVTEALRLTGSAPRRRLDASPVVTTVGGRVAADLRLLGTVPTARRRLRALAPAAAGRHLRAAWRVGRLRAALPGLTDDLVAATDEALAEVPALAELDDEELTGLLQQSRRALVAVHGHEVLAGALLDGHQSSAGSTAAGLALRTVATARGRGLADDDLVARHPVVLTLAPPRIGARPRLPDERPRRGRLPDVAALPPREALRLRARWLQELTARAAEELGRRLHASGALPTPEAVCDLALEELLDVVAGSPPPADLASRAASTPAPPLPTAFRVTPSGAVRAARVAGGASAGTGASPGRAVGRVVDVDGALAAPTGSATVLVTQALAPDLAPLLPRLSGLVTETGSVLSHLAILARELHVPTVVAVPGAVTRFPAGATVAVDGTTGEVAVVDAPPEVTP